MLILEADRLILRPFQDSDLQVFVAYRSDPDIAKYQAWDVPYSNAQAARFIEEMQTLQPGVPGEWYQLAIMLKRTNQMIGDCAFCILPADDRQAEIGFTLARQHHGNGYAIEAVTRLLNYLFNELQLHRVQALCHTDNTASVKLLERLSFRREAQYLEHVWFKGQWANEYGYALLRREWINQTKSK